MSIFGCARWRAPMKDQPIEDAPLLVFQSGHVFNEGQRVGVYQQSGTHFVAGLDAETTLIIPLNQVGPDQFSATFRLGDGDGEICLPGALIREALN